MPKATSNKKKLPNYKNKKGELSCVFFHVPLRPLGGPSKYYVNWNPTQP